MKETEIMRLEDIMEVLGIGRDKAYALLKSPFFPATKIGRTYFVTADHFKEWLDKYAGKEFYL